MAMATRQSGLTFLVMCSASVLPAHLLPISYPATRRGYNSYLKALGINPKDYTTVAFAAIPFAQFASMDRRSLDEKIQEAAAECARLHDVFVEATNDGRMADAGFAEMGWDRRSKEFIELMRIKHNS